MEDVIRIAGIIQESFVDGPGIRYVIFTQGCKHNCQGCHNQHTHDFAGGKDKNLSEIVKEITANPLIQGITLSGGEPFEQAKQLKKLIQMIKKERKELDYIAYSGYLFEQLIKHPDCLALLEEINYLIDGKFELALKNELLLFKGSSNQRTLDVQRSLKDKSVFIHDFKEV